MNVPPQQQSIPCLVLSAIAIGTDMGSLEGWQRPFLRYCAAQLIDGRDKHPECTLSEAGANELRLAKSRRLNVHPRLLRLAEAFVHRFPQSQSLGVTRVVGLERHDVRRPVRRHRNPIALGEEGLRQNTAADFEVAATAWFGATVASDAGAHLLRRAGTVGLSECFPGQRARQRISIGEDAPADDHTTG